MLKYLNSGRTKQGKVPMRMTKAEIEQLKKSADALKEIIAQIDLD